MIRDRLLSGLRDADIIYLYDERENSRWGMLRSLPALHYMGVNDFTYPTSWCQLASSARQQLLEYNYHVVSNSLDIPSEHPDFGVVTNTYYEEETQYTIKYLINRYTLADAPLFVVADDRAFTPQDAKRPLYQDPHTDEIGAYDDVYDEYTQAYKRSGWACPLSDTKNLFIQDNANIYELVTDEQVSTTAALFERLPDAPYLPLYRVMADIFSRPTEFGSVPLGADEGVPHLVRWFRRRIEWERDVARDAVTSLNQAVIDDGSTFDMAAARRRPAMRKARRAAKRLEPEQSAVDQRYDDWFQEYKI